MNAFSAFVRKETQHILRDKRTLLVAIVIPVVLLLLFGFAISTDVTEIDFAVVAPEMSQPVRKQIARLESNSLFDLKGYVDESEVEGLLKRNEVMAVVIFDRNYDLGEEADGIRVVVDASNTNTAQASANYLMQALTNGGGGERGAFGGGGERGAFGGGGERDAFGGGERGLSAGGGAAMPNVTVLYNPLLLSSYNFVPGIMGMIFLLICAMLTSVSIVREKETGTMEVLLVSPVSPGMIVIAKMVPYLVLSCIDLAIILLLSRFALDVPLSGSMVALLTVAMIYLMLALALGLLISTLVDSQMVALLISGMVLIVPVIMLSGMLFPIENMPDVLQWLSSIVPARWFISAMRKLMIQGLGFGAVLTETAVLIGMTAVFLMISVKRFKNRLE